MKHFCFRPSACVPKVEWRSGEKIHLALMRGISSSVPCVRSEARRGEKRYAEVRPGHERGSGGREARGVKRPRQEKKVGGGGGGVRDRRREGRTEKARGRLLRQQPSHFHLRLHPRPPEDQNPPPTASLEPLHNTHRRQHRCLNYSSHHVRFIHSHRHFDWTC